MSNLNYIPNWKKQGEDKSEVLNRLKRFINEKENNDKLRDLVIKAEFNPKNIFIDSIELTSHTDHSFTEVLVSLNQEGIIDSIPFIVSEEELINVFNGKFDHYNEFECHEEDDKMCQFIYYSSKRELEQINTDLAKLLINKVLNNKMEVAA